MLLVVAMLVAPLRRSFYRHASLLSGPLEASSAIPLFTLVICLLALAGTRPRVHLLANNAWWAVVMSRRCAELAARDGGAGGGAGTDRDLAAAAAGKVRWLPWDSAARQRLARLGGTIPPARADGVVLGEAERAGIPFRRCGPRAAGAGRSRWARKPTGSRRSGGCATSPSRRGWIPPFWRAGSGLLKVYADLGLTALPLGADGLPLAEVRLTIHPRRGSIWCAWPSVT